MAERIMSREETFTWCRQLGLAVLVGKDTNLPEPGGTHACREDVADAMSALARELSERFDRIPEKVTDDPKAQEAIRTELDQVTAALALYIEEHVAISERQL